MARTAPARPKLATVKLDASLVLKAKGYAVKRSQQAGRTVHLQEVLAAALRQYLKRRAS